MAPPISGGLPGYEGGGGIYTGQLPRGVLGRAVTEVSNVENLQRKLDGVSFVTRKKKTVKLSKLNSPKKISNDIEGMASGVLNLLEKVKPYRGESGPAFLQQHSQVVDMYLESPMRDFSGLPEGSPQTIQLINERDILCGKQNRLVDGDILAPGSRMEPGSDYQEHKRQVAHLKTELNLLRAGFSNVVLDTRTERLFDHILLRVRNLDILWATHYEKMKSLFTSVIDEHKSAQNKLKNELQGRLQDTILKMEEEKGKLLERITIERELHARSQHNQQRSLNQSIYRVGHGAEPFRTFNEKGIEESHQGENFSNSKADLQFEGTSQSGSEGRNGKEDNDSLFGDRLLLEGLSAEQRLQTLAGFSAFELSQHISSLSEDDLYFLVSNLDEKALKALLECMLGATTGEVRAGLLHQLLQIDKLIPLLQGDAESLSALVTEMCIEDRRKLLAHLLQHIDVVGFAGSSSGHQFDKALQRYIELDEFSTPDDQIDDKEINREEIIGSSYDLPRASISLEKGAMIVRGLGSVRDAGTTMNSSMTAANSSESLLEEMKQVLLQSQPNAEIQGSTIKGFENLESGKSFTFRIEIKRGKGSSSADGSNLQQSIFMKRVHPWEKFLRQPKKKIRDISSEALGTSIIGEIYARKILLDRDNRKKGMRKPLCNVVMDYFTQKYGLKKISNEYTLSVVKKLRQCWAESKRFETFAMSVGVIQSSFYTPLLGDMITEYLVRLFGGPDQVAAAFGKAKLYVPMGKAVHAAFSIFRVDDLEDTPKHAEEQDNAGFTNPGSPKKKQLQETIKKGIKRRWTMPLPLRQLLVDRLMHVAKPACEIEHVKDDGNVLLTEVDLVLEAVMLLFVEKLVMDQKMLMHLFVRFDTDGNGVLSFQEFQELITACQPSQELSEDAIFDLWNMVNEAEEDDDGDTVTKEGFAEVCISQGLQLNYWKLMDVKGQLDYMLSQVKYFGQFCVDGSATVP